MFEYQTLPSDKINFGQVVDDNRFNVFTNVTTGDCANNSSILLQISSIFCCFINFELSIFLHLNNAKKICQT